MTYFLIKKSFIFKKSYDIKHIQNNHKLIKKQKKLKGKILINTFLLFIRLSNYVRKKRENEFLFFYQLLIFFFGETSLKIFLKNLFLISSLQNKFFF